jgi:hypothetical protein
MPGHTIGNRMEVRPNEVCVIPPNTAVILKDGHLALKPRHWYCALRQRVRRKFGGTGDPGRMRHHVREDEARIMRRMSRLCVFKDRASLLAALQKQI